MDLVLRLAAGVLLILANAFFVAVEFALTRLAQADRSELPDSPGMERALSMLDRLEIHLTGCQLGISTSSVVLGVVAEPAITELIRPAVGVFGVEGAALRTTSVVVAVVLLNLVHKIWGEQAPTYLGVERPHQVAARLAPILYWWSRVMKPVIKLGDGLAKLTLKAFGVEMTRSWTEAETESGDGGGEEDASPPVGSRAELKRRMGELLRLGDLPPERTEEVVAALEIGRMEVRQVMTPREEMVCLRADATPEEVFRLVQEHPHVRYPVLRDGGGSGGGVAGDFAGFLYLPALFEDPEALRTGTLDVHDLLVEVERVAADEEVSDLIDILQEARQEVALVEEDGRVVGMVTVTDALEAIVGDLEDPLDALG